MSAALKRRVKVGVYAVAVCFWLYFIFSNSLKSRSDSAHQSAYAEGLFRRVLAFFGLTGDTARTAALVVRKSAHVFEFFILFLLFALLFSALFKSIRAVLVVGSCASVICACIDESLQIISHRGASVKDVFIDGVGIILAALLYLLLVRLRRKNTEKRK